MRKTPCFNGVVYGAFAKARRAEHRRNKKKYIANGVFFCGATNRMCKERSDGIGIVTRRVDPVTGDPVLTKKFPC